MSTVITTTCDPTSKRCGSPNDLKQMLIDALDGARTVSERIDTTGPDDTAEITLPAIPPHAIGAVVYLEANPLTSDMRKACRFTESTIPMAGGGRKPTATFGFPLGDSGEYKIKSRVDLLNFRIIGVDPGLSHNLTVKYFCVDGEQ